MRAELKNDPRLDEHLGVNYDCCHFAVEFEEPQAALNSLQRGPGNQDQQNPFEFRAERPGRRRRSPRKPLEDNFPTMFTCTRSLSAMPPVIGAFSGTCPMPLSTNCAKKSEDPKSESIKSEEWRNSFPRSAPRARRRRRRLKNTNDHLLGVLDVLAENPGLCSHFEMETYTLGSAAARSWKSRKNVVEATGGGISLDARQARRKSAELAKFAFWELSFMLCSVSCRWIPCETLHERPT